MKDQLDISSITGNNSQSELTSLLKEYASQHQRDIRSFISSKSGEVADLNSFWIFNGLSLTTTKSMMLALNERDDVE
jgi:hypothetical protein